MGTLRDKPAQAVGLLIVALIALAFSLYWTFGRSNQPPIVQDSALPSSTPTPPPPPSPDGTIGQTVPY
ncbi:MAG: hypothetical protein ACK4UU_07100 [Fimbriimonadales bacterium]